MMSRGYSVRICYRCAAYVRLKIKKISVVTIYAYWRNFVARIYESLIRFMNHKHEKKITALNLSRTHACARSALVTIKNQCYLPRSVIYHYFVVTDTHFSLYLYTDNFYLYTNNF